MYLKLFFYILCNGNLNLCRQVNDQASAFREVKMEKFESTTKAKIRRVNRTIENIYRDLLELSDITLQKKLWLNQNNNTGLLSSYSELMCRLFDDND